MTRERRQTWFQIQRISIAAILIASAGSCNRPGEGEGAPELHEQAVTVNARRKAVMVVSEGPLNASDSAMRDRLESLGFLTEAVEDKNVREADANEAALVLVSESASSVSVGDRLKNLAVPVLLMEPSLFDDMRMTRGEWQRDFGDRTGQTAVTISLPEHPLAAGISGRVTVANTQGKFVWGDPCDSATVVATLEGATGAAAVFAYETGARMQGMKAPARRVGWFAGRDVAATFTPDGWKLFDAAVRFSSRPTALLVVKDADLSVSDGELLRRLKDLGFEVTTKSGSALSTTDATNKTLVVVSESTESATIGSKLTGVAAPMLVMEPALLDELGVTGPTWQVDYGDEYNQTAIDIVNPNHPLAAGFQGPLEVALSPQKMIWALPPSSATIVATLKGRPKAAAIFGLERGARMHAGFANARITGWLAGRDLPAQLSPKGWLLFDAAVGWTSGVFLPQTGPSPVLSEQFTFDIPFAKGRSSRDVAVAGTYSVEIGDGASVVGGANPTVLGGQGGVSFSGPASLHGDLFTTGGVRGADGSDLRGDVFSRGAPFNSSSCSTVFAPAENGDILLRSGRAKVAFPGSYADVAVESGGKLYLTSGKYHFDSLILSEGSSVIVSDGLVVIYVRDQFSSAASISRLGGGKPSVFVGYAGAESVRVNGNFQGTIVAPRATVEVAAGTSMLGSLFGATVKLGSGAKISHDPAMLDLVCNAPLSNAKPIVESMGPADLVASVEHNGSAKPGTFSPSTLINFQIPSRLLVDSGNAGNYPAVLGFVDPQGRKVTCSYRGGAGVAHPLTRLDLAKGTQYDFVACDNGLGPLAETRGKTFTLEISGDPLAFGPPKTAVSLTVQESRCKPRMGSFITPGDAIAAYEKFDWAKTTALAEKNPDGSPTLYYANIWVSGADDIDRLDALLIR